MQKKVVNYSDTGFFPEIVLDYLQGAKRLNPFYKLPPRIGSFEQQIGDRKSLGVNRKLLHQVLEEQYAKVATKRHAASENIRALLNENTFTITTGHQLCLFTGPLYVIYKITSAIVLSRELQKAYPGSHFVPVFWMATEDHDFKEIDHVHLFGKTLKWEQEQEGAVGRLSTRTLKPMLQELKAILGESKHAKELLALFRSAYIDHDNLADATRYLLNELFGEQGLVVLDPDDARLKRSFIPVMKDELLNRTSQRLVEETTELLSEYYKPNVNPRPVNLFCLESNSRKRITKTTDALVSELEEHPEKFSPNVVLRPLYQESVLPNLAYIGGGSELSYWLQLKNVFEHYSVSYPVLVLRNSVMWIDDTASSMLEKLHIRPGDLFQGEEELIREFIKKNARENLDLTREKMEITAVYDRLRSKATNTDRSLTASVEAELQRHLKALAGLEKRLIKAEKQKHETSVAQIRKIRKKLFPLNGLQERYDNFMPFFLDHGKGFFASLQENFHALEGKFTILRSDH